MAQQQVITVQEIKEAFWHIADNTGAAYDDPSVRSEILSTLKKIHSEGLQDAERDLQENGRGRECAARICILRDNIIRAIFSFASDAVFRSQNRSTSEVMTVLAVGGYGRGYVAPGSDIDLLFLLPYKQTPWGESVVEYILYLLWDMGLKVGHATRRVDEAIRLSIRDMTVRTSALEARLLAGDETLFADFRQRFQKEIMSGSAADFIQAKLAERNERHKRNGQSRYLVEPNVKEGKGGLRDLHTLFWIGKYYFQADHWSVLVKAGLMRRAEFNRFIKCSDFLWAVRCHLHFLTGRAEERLSFDVQQALAHRLNYTSHAGLRDVERFMKHYFLVAKDVGNLTRIVCAELEERQIKEAPGLNRFLTVFRGRRRKAIANTKDFIVENNRIAVADREVFKRDGVNLIRIFALADQHNFAFHPDTVALMARSLSLINSALRENETANKLFLDILTSPNDPESVLRRMNEIGVLGRFVLDFGKIVAMMQFNMYHHYTVDEHLLRAIGILSEIEHGALADDHPLANDLIKTIEDRRILYMALFLHDIAKGRPEDHSVAGARVARKLCRRCGFSDDQTEIVVWLVKQHLTMSVIAQSRDLNDRKTILDFAKQVETLERLKLLLILTVADIKAVGPGVWNGWKGQLLRTLYYETEPILTGGHSEISRAGRINFAKEALAQRLAAWPTDLIENYLECHQDPYWLRVDEDAQYRHATLYSDHLSADHHGSTAVQLFEFEEITEITLLTENHPMLLAAVTGICAQANANIVDAQIYTTRDGKSLNIFYLSRLFSDDVDEQRRADQICSRIVDRLAQPEDIPLIQVVGKKSSKINRSKAFRVATKISFNNRISEQCTFIEIACGDRPGLLHQLTRFLSQEALNIVSAHIVTFGEKALDTFYVVDEKNQKITSPSHQARLREKLVKTINPTRIPRAKVSSAAAE